MRSRHLANHQIPRRFLVAFPITAAIREFLDVYPALSVVIKSSAISQIVQWEFMIGAMNELGPDILEKVIDRARKLFGLRGKLGRNLLHVTDTLRHRCNQFGSVIDREPHFSDLAVDFFSRLRVCRDKIFTSAATTPNPLPASPSRAASMVAFNAKGFVCPAIEKSVSPRHRFAVKRQSVAAPPD